MYIIDRSIMRMLRKIPHFRAVKRSSKIAQSKLSQSVKNLAGYKMASLNKLLTFLVLAGSLYDVLHRYCFTKILTRPIVKT